MQRLVLSAFSFLLSPVPSGLRSLLTCFTVALCATGFGQTKQTLIVRDFVTKNRLQILSEFTSFVSIPNVARDSANINKNATFILGMMKARGIQNTKLLFGRSHQMPPVVYGEVLTPGAKQTLKFYAHYDGQPVNPAQWAEGLSPFDPKMFTSTFDKGKPVDLYSSSIENDYRIYARGASDDKAGVIAILTAFDALRQTKSKLDFNIKFFFEGEEEAGSPHLQEILETNREILTSDLWIICDGPVHQSGKKVICFGVRGDAHVEVTVYGPMRPLHSGHYGNWAPNPGLMLAHLLTSMKDENGRVQIDGFYDDVKPLSASEQQALSQVPRVDEQMKEELGLSWTENPDKSLVEAVSMPSLNINGMQSGNVGKMASNQIPTFATAVLDLRLVLGNDWRKQQQKVIAHIRKHGYDVIDHDPTVEDRKKFSRLAKVIAGDDGYNAQRTSMDLPVAKKIADAIASTTSEPIVRLPSMGGSLPLYVIEQVLGAKTLVVPIANHDNNQHAENENIKLGNLFSGIETLAAVMEIRN